MVDEVKFKEWLQTRVDYWESVCEKHKSVRVIKKCERDFDEGMEKGILEGLYQVIEYIEAQKKGE